MIDAIPDTVHAKREGPMPHYTFSIRDTETVTEKLGSDVLDNDADALAFGRHVIRDLMREDEGLYFGWSMDIADGERAVGSISFKSQVN
jgi:hypothetical protein